MTIFSGSKLRAAVLLKITALLAVLCLGVALSAKADETYGLTLTPTFGSTAGSGSLTVAGPVPASGTFFVSEGGPGAHDLSALSILIGGNIFNLSDGSSYVGDSFSNGALSSLGYLGNDGAALLVIWGDTYTYTSFSNPRTDTKGVVTDSLPAAEPASVLLLLSGLLAVGLLAALKDRLSVTP